MKPYDVEEARTDLKNACLEAEGRARLAIIQAAEEAIKRLEIQARAFADLPRDLPSLFMEASHVEIAELDPKAEGFETRDHMPVNFGVRLYGRPMLRTKELRLPFRKHRVLVFMIPMED
jgi:hypothetical protein